MKATKQSGVALVVTLLMLSVITFLTVTFLALSRRDRASVAVSLTQKESRMMSDVALARAQSEIIVRMMGTLNSSNQPEILNYDLMVSRNYINRRGFVSGSTDATNVNYDYYNNGSVNFSTADKIQNIANLYYDPRPPVYVKTNASPSAPLDFRYYVDLNRNGRFETNGLMSPVDDLGKSFNFSNTFVGEPEWIGVLRNPELKHSAANPFTGRFAYLVQPIGKTLDINYIHNFSKGVAKNFVMPTNGFDGFMRNQGLGSWEINLAALLREINPNAYVSNSAQFHYVPMNASTLNDGPAFGDACSLLRSRYGANYLILSNAVATLGNSAYTFTNDCIDDYGVGQRLTAPFDYTPTTDPDIANFVSTKPWAGSDNPVKFYNLLNELYDAKRFPTFSDNILTASKRTNSAGRYSLQKLLSSIGTESAPELQVELPLRDGSWEKRTKININYDNTHEITNALNHAQTNYLSWTATRFFTNAADLILRLQFTNDPNRRITNLCVYSGTNASLVYDETVHRCLQLAANIYDATTNFHDTSVNSKQFFPHVFRPLFWQRTNSTSTNVFIVGYQEVQGTAGIKTNNFGYLWTSGFKDLVGSTIERTNNVWGIPLIIGAKKGLPNFNEFYVSNSMSISRKLTFTKSKPMDHPDGTNQVMLFSFTNSIGVELWNSYANAFSNSVQIIITNWTRLSLTNEQGAGQNVIVWNFSNRAVTNWPGYVRDGDSSFIIPLQTNRAVLPGFCQFKEMTGQFVSTDNGSNTVSDSGNGLPVHDWVMSMTNNLVCVIIETNTQRVLDFVNLGGRGLTTNLSVWLRSGADPNNLFLTNGANNTINSPASAGVTNQIAMNFGKMTGAPDDQGVGIKNLTDWWSDINSTDPKAAWFQPTANLNYVISWQANDPLVHYTYGDLEDPHGFNEIAAANQITSLGGKNARYQPWQVNPNTRISLNTTIQDPNIARSDDWDFPTNKFPNVGWLGRVHRGTPWQTIFLKADGTNAQNQLDNRTAWSSWWATINTYPTNDWALVDLFTVAPNDNASCGTLSVNQTNLAPWSAVFSGSLALLTKTNGVLIDPTNVPAIFDGRPNVPGINAIRNQKPNRVFHRIGEILEAPSLTIGSPFVGNPSTNRAITDAVLEAIPQRSLSLLRLGQPRFVIWAYGQSLKPAALNLSGGPNNGVPLNYQIIGESLTRTVCRVERDSKNVPRIVVESFNVVPGE